MTAALVVAQRITSPGVAEPPAAPFSAALRVGDELIISGMTAGGSHAGTGADAGAQARECLRRIQALAEAAGGSLDNVLKLVIYLTDMADREAVNTARREAFQPPYPASTLVGVAALVAPTLRVEIDATIRLDATRRPPAS